MNQRGRLFFCITWGIFLIGCDRHPAPPPPAPPTASAAPAPPQPARPTTQELLAGPYKKLVLPGMPLAVQAPPSWKIEIDGSLTFLEGPTPSYDAMIQLAQRESLRPDQVDILLEGVKRDQDQHPETVKRADLRQVGDMRILDQLSISQPITTPKVDSKGDAVLDAHGNILTVTTTAAHWKLTVLVPYEKMFSVYELNFIDLTGEQYALDKDFLQKILASLSYENSQATGQ
jgi:hypothetical protein